MLRRKSHPKTTDPNHHHKDASHSGKDAADPTQAGHVCPFLVMVDHVMTAVLLGTTNKQTVSSVSREVPCNGAHIFL